MPDDKRVASRPESDTLLNEALDLEEDRGYEDGEEEFLSELRLGGRANPALLVKLGAVVQQELEDLRVTANLDVNDVALLPVITHLPSRLAVQALREVLHLADDQILLRREGLHDFLLLVHYLYVDDLAFPFGSLCFRIGSALSSSLLALLVFLAAARRLRFLRLLRPAAPGRLHRCQSFVLLLRCGPLGVYIDFPPLYLAIFERVIRAIYLLRREVLILGHTTARSGATGGLRGLMRRVEVAHNGIILCGWLAEAFL